MQGLKLLNLKKIAKEYFDLTSKEGIFFCIAATACTFIGVLFCAIVGYRDLGIFKCFVVIIVSILYFAFLIAICVLLAQNKKKQLENQALSQYRQGMLDIFSESNIARHNYKNSLIVLKGCCMERDYEQLNQYLDKLVNDFSSTYEKEQYDAIEKIQNPAIKWLLISKTVMAKKAGIQLMVVISDQFSCYCIKEHEFCSILGNLIDNAIEAAAESSRRQVELFLLDRGEEIFLSIQNTVLNEPDISRLFEKGYSTKEEHTGLGLYSIKRIMNQYSDAAMDIKMEGSFFTIDITLPKRDPHE